MTPWDKTLFTIAERLGMTVARLKTEMPLPELIRWVEFLNGHEAPVDLTQATPEQLGAMFGA